MNDDKDIGVTGENIHSQIPVPTLGVKDISVPVPFHSSVSHKGISHDKRMLLISVIVAVVTIILLIIIVFLFFVRENSKTSDTSQIPTTTSATTTLASTVVTTIVATTTEAPMAPVKFTNFSIQFNRTPVKLTNPNLINETNISAAIKSGDFFGNLCAKNSNYDYYMVGKVISGIYTGLDVVFAVDNGSCDISSFGEAAPGTRANPVVYIKKDATNYITTSFGDNKPLQNITYFDQSKLFNVKMTFVGNETINDYLVTFTFKDLIYSSPTFADFYGMVDTSTLGQSYTAKDGTLLYISKDPNLYGSMLFKNVLGFYSRSYGAPLFANDAKYDSIVWSSPKSEKNTDQYTGHVGCGLTQKYVDPGLNQSLIHAVGTSTTDNSAKFYEYIDPSQDPLVKKIYNEDYIAQGINKQNLTTADDATPFTLAQIAAMHPVFYWTDPFGFVQTYLNTSFIFVGGCAKPAVYLYPQKTTSLTVNIKIDGLLAHALPEYDFAKGWNVTANPNGDITTSDDKKYDYLFWDGQFNTVIDQSKQGFVIKVNEVDSFLNSTLDQYGFNSKEKSQFVEYWSPILKNGKQKYLYLNFLDERFMDKFASLSFSQKPDSYKRIFMIYKGLDTPLAVTAPVVHPFTRSGFFVFEWGGARI